MRTALALPLGLAMALASGSSRAEPPRVSMRLDYARGQGGETCPAEPSALRAAVALAMGYDPFEPGDASPERLAVTVSRQGRGFAARIERYGPSGALTWSHTFPGRGDTCAALAPPLAIALTAWLLAPPASPPAAPSPPPASPPPEPPAPAPSPPPSAAAPLAPAAQPAIQPEPPNVPNPARSTAKGVAYVSYAAGVVFLGLGIGFSVYAEKQTRAALDLSDQVVRAGGTMGCTAGTLPGGDCKQVVRAWQSSDKALDWRNAWFAAAGAAVAVGTVAMVWAVNLPAQIKPQTQTQLRLTPGGLVLSGTF